MLKDNNTTEKKIDLLVGRKIVQFRKNYLLTQKELSEKLNISINQLRKYEQGKNSLSVGKLFELCVIFNCAYTDLLDE